MQLKKQAILMLMTLPALTCAAESGKLSATSGLDYSSGDYGTGRETESWVLPLGLKYQIGRYSFRVGTSYLWVRGPQNVTPEGEPIPGGGPVKTTHGLGDVSASFAANVLDDRNAPIGLDLLAKVKFGTASTSKALGTGENDYALQASLFKIIDAWEPYLDIGYRWKGDPSGVDYRNVWYGAAGASYRFSRIWSAGADYAWRDKLTAGGDPVSEATLYANYRISDHNKLNFYGMAGFSDASPDWGLGFTLSHSF